MSIIDTQCEPVRQQKYVDILMVSSRLDDIFQHIMDLNNKLGVNTPKQENSDIPSIESLVDVLDHLPSIVDDKVSQIHDLLNNLDKNLI